jgi:thiamine biosynthesis protein ThiI
MERAQKDDSFYMTTRADTCILVHYHEIALKGKNRGYFELQLARNIRKALHGLPYRDVERLNGRLVVHLSPESDLDVVTDRLRRVFGIAYFAPARLVANDLDTLKQTAWSLVEGRRFDSFKIETRRAHKAYSLTSPQINAEVGALVQEKSGAAVNLGRPELTCHIEILRDAALIWADRIDGPGGLPVGVSEQAVVLLSSGIDSPVASYKMMKRGVRLRFVHFHSHPYTSPASMRNAEALVRVLTEYQFRSTLFLVPFLEIQQHIISHAPTSYGVLLYRRAMVRIAEILARRGRARALITGESVGQVASQTLSNILVVNDAATLPVLRPLIGDDKDEIIQLARRIGTYEISIEPYEDCCSLFVPRNPETKANLSAVRRLEAGLELQPLIARAIEQTEKKVITLE